MAKTVAKQPAPPPSSKIQTPGYFDNLFGNVRFYFIASSVVLSLLIYFIYSDKIIELTQSYALLALIYLYLAMMATPITKTFTTFPLKALYIKSRRGIGVSAFYFAFLHACFAFFGQLGGFAGLPFLTDKYLLAISLSFTALIILMLMAGTSFDYMISKLGFLRWKMLHRFVYLAALFILIHALMLGSHFADLSSIIPQICFVALAVLLFLEGNRLDNYLQNKIPALPKYGVVVILVALFVLWYALFLYWPKENGLVSLGIHSQHIQIAKDNQKALSPSPNSNLPSTMQGDRTKRYTVSFFHPEQVEASRDAKLSFKVYDASSGNPVSLYSQVYTKLMHLIIVDQELKHFAHIHPEQTENSFEITTQFPYSSRYHLYSDFQPLGAIEQQVGFTLDVGQNQTLPKASFQPDQNLTKKFGKYTVSLKHPTPLKASDMSEGRVRMMFTLSDGSTGQPVNTLKPYLASFGHLVMINQETYDYLHVHPTNLVAPAPDANGGPTVEFLPLGLYSPIKPGIYRVFAQFNPNDELILADFTINVVN